MAIAPISSLQDMGRPSSASTLAAASRALGFFSFGSVEAFRWRFGLAAIGAVASAVADVACSAGALGTGAVDSGAVGSVVGVSSSFAGNSVVAGVVSGWDCAVSAVVVSAGGA